MNVENPMKKATVPVEKASKATYWGANMIQWFSHMDVEVREADHSGADNPPASHNDQDLAQSTAFSRSPRSYVVSIDRERLMRPRGF